MKDDIPEAGRSRDATHAQPQVGACMRKTRKSCKPALGILAQDSEDFFVDLTNVRCASKARNCSLGSLRQRDCSNRKALQRWGRWQLQGSLELMHGDDEFLLSGPVGSQARLSKLPWYK